MTLPIEQAGRIIDIFQAVGIRRILDGEDVLVQAVTRLQNVLRILQIALRQMLHLGRSNPLGEQQFLRIGIIDRFRRSKMAQKGQPDLIGQAWPLRQPQPIFEHCPLPLSPFWRLPTTPPRQPRPR